MFNKDDVFYRFKDHYMYQESDIGMLQSQRKVIMTVTRHKYYVRKVNPVSVWVSQRPTSKQHLITYNTLRSYAFADPKRAWENFYHRKKKQLRLIHEQYERCNALMNIMNKEDQLDGSYTFYLD